MAQISGGIWSMIVSAVFAITMIGLLLSYSADITQTVQDGFSDNTSQAYNVTVDSLDAMGNISERMPTLSTILMIGAIIAVLMFAFAVVKYR